jgi:hypothetical protein
MIRWTLLAALSLAAPAFAADPFAVYHTDSGTLPPEYAWATDVTIDSEGLLTLRHCTGYQTEGPACKTRRARVTPEELAAIREAALASGLAETPARAAEYPMVGGSMTYGRVHLDGITIELPSDPLEADAARVALVLRQVEAAIPSGLGRFLED